MLFKTACHNPKHFSKKFKLALKIFQGLRDVPEASAEVERLHLQARVEGALRLRRHLHR